MQVQGQDSLRQSWGPCAIAVCGISAYLRLLDSLASGGYETIVGLSERRRPGRGDINSGGYSMEGGTVIPPVSDHTMRTPPIQDSLHLDVVSVWVECG